MLTSRVRSSKVSWQPEELHDHLGDLTRPDCLHKGRSSRITPAQTVIHLTRNGPGDDLVLSLSAKGLTRGEIAAHLPEVCRTEMSKQTISSIADNCSPRSG